MTTAPAVDLTPFGFTPTESLAYSALLERGPTSAYALAKALDLARANMYQALHGLASKGAASRIEESPQVYRAIQPTALLALIAERTGANLQRLESELRAREQTGEPATIEFATERAFREIALRTAVRADQLTCIAPPDVLESLNPVWRKRALDGSPTHLWALGEDPPELAIAPSGTIDPGRVQAHFTAPAVLLLTGDAAILARRVEEQLMGYWTSDPIFIGLARGSAERLTAL